MHGWGITQRLQNASRDVLQVAQGSLYPALHRLEAKGLLSEEWGRTDRNREAKFYSLTKQGRAQLRAEVARWNTYARVVTAALATTRG